MAMLRLFSLLLDNVSTFFNSHECRYGNWSFRGNIPTSRLGFGIVCFRGCNFSKQPMKNYLDYRIDVESINTAVRITNEAAEKDNAQRPIPEASMLRKKLFAKQVIPQRLNSYWRENT
jgi:hypothetical protein